MKRLHTRLIVFGILAIPFCFIPTFSGCGSEELELEQKTDAFLEAGDYKSALKLIDSFIQKHPEKPIGHAMRMRILAADGQIEKALKAYYRFYKLGGTPSEALLSDILRGALNHDNRWVQSKAAAALEELEGKRAVPALINLLNHDSWRVRSRAAQALGKLGDTRAVPALINALNDDDGWVREGVAEVLKELGDERAIPALIEVIGDNDRDIYAKFEALGVLVKLSQSIE
jgi:HEAT repeat protein